MNEETFFAVPDGRTDARRRDRLSIGIGVKLLAEDGHPLNGPAAPPALQTIAACTESAPVRIVEPAEAPGLRLANERSLRNEISGQIECGPDGHFHVTLHANHGPDRLRFTLAREIADLVLRRDIVGDGITLDAGYRSMLGEIRDRNANQFAADLLTPAPTATPIPALPAMAPIAAPPAAPIAPPLTHRDALVVPQETKARLATRVVANGRFFMALTYFFIAICTAIWWLTL